MDLLFLQIHLIFVIQQFFNLFYVFLIQLSHLSYFFLQNLNFSLYLLVFTVFAVQFRQLLGLLADFIFEFLIFNFQLRVGLNLKVKLVLKLGSFCREVLGIRIFLAELIFKVEQFNFVVA